METLQETLGRYDAEALLTSNLWMRYNALAADVRNILGIYERSMRTLPDDLEWNGMDRDEVAEAIAYGLTFPVKRTYMAYVLSMTASFDVLPDNEEDGKLRIGCRHAQLTKPSVIVTLKTFELDERVCIVTYEIVDSAFEKHECNAAFELDWIIGKPKAKLRGE